MDSTISQVNHVYTGTGCAIKSDVRLSGFYEYYHSDTSLATHTSDTRFRRSTTVHVFVALYATQLADGFFGRGP